MLGVTVPDVCGAGVTCAYKWGIPLVIQDKSFVPSQAQLAAQDPEAFKIVLNLSETVLGAYGVDLIWLIWRQIRHVEDQAENAEKLRKKLIVLSQSARPALRVAIELDYYQKCPNLEGVVKRAAKYADSRSLSSLELLKRTTGCGPRGSPVRTIDRTCLPCPIMSHISQSGMRRKAASIRFRTECHSMSQ